MSKDQNSELRTQIFIYLTNNVYNYIQILNKYLINQVRTLSQRQRFAANIVATHEKLAKSNHNVACQPYCGVQLKFNYEKQSILIQYGALTPLPLLITFGVLALCTFHTFYSYIIQRYWGTDCICTQYLVSQSY